MDVHRSIVQFGSRFVVAMRRRNGEIPSVRSCVQLWAQAPMWCWQPVQKCSSSLGKVNIGWGRKTLALRNVVPAFCAPIMTKSMVVEWLLKLT